MPALVSSRMISLHNSTHSSQMNTVGPAISLRTSCCDLPQKLQYRVLFASDPLSFVMLYPNRPAGTKTQSIPAACLINTLARLPIRPGYNQHISRSCTRHENISQVNLRFNPS